MKPLLYYYPINVTFAWVVDVVHHQCSCNEKDYYTILVSILNINYTIIYMYKLNVCYIAMSIDAKVQ